MDDRRRALMAYILPFGLFMVLLACEGGLASLGKDSPHLLLREPKYWIFPLQALLCAIALGVYWKSYSFGPFRSWLAGVGAGLLVLVIWVSPQAFFGFAPRTEGFNPEVFANDPLLYWLTVIGRFARLAIVVPLIEEIFWRGFLMRYLINEDFEKVALGAFSWFSFLLVAVLFTFEHGKPDWAAAFVTGLIYNGLLVKTKSLSACVIAHAVTNFGLGIYTMATKQWGFW